MASIQGKISDFDVIASGVILAGHGQAIVIHPFYETDYCFNLEIEVDQGDPTPTSVGIPGEIFTVRIKRGWFGGQPSIINQILIANNQIHNFYVSIKVGLIGNFDDYSVDLSYVVLRKIRS